MKPILEIQNISKKYKLRGQEMPYLTIRETLLGKNKQRESNEFWALKNINFDVFPGESIGIIGKNGAGKSTLLKILSKITPPTEGQIIARGRVASLLEVGTGFHPELTGMENIFLNGSILGLKKTEIKKKLDEIINFAGVEKFINTPLKHFSSGMQLRLAFAVAAHLEPEILIVDEVLAVGDAEFQKKAIGKMKDVSQDGGRTVLFVSHNMGSIKTLCNKAVLLNDGFIDKIGASNGVVDHYLKSTKKTSEKLEKLKARKGNGKVIFSDFYITDCSNNKVNTLLTGGDYYFCFVLKTNDYNIHNVDVDFSIHQDDEEPLTVTRSSYYNLFFDFDSLGRHLVRFYSPNLNLAPGNKKVRGMLLIKDIVSDWPEEILGEFNVVMGDFYKSGNLKFNKNVKILLNGKWSNKQDDQ